MDYQHPSPEQLAQFLARAELGKEECMLIVSHLIADCKLCQQVIAMETNPRLKIASNYDELTAHHAIAWCYNELGDHEEARAIVDTYDHLYRQFLDAATVGNRRWLR